MPTSILSITFTISCLLLLHYTYGQKSQVPTLEDPSFENYFLNPDHIPVLQGKILNATPEDLPHLKITAHVVRVGPKTQKAFPIQIEDDFTFRLKLEYSFPYQEIWFSLQDYYYAELMLQDSLMITMDLHKLKKNQQKYVNEGVEFSGPDAPLTLYLNRYNIFQKEDKNKAMNPAEKAVIDMSLSLDKKLEIVEKSNLDLMGIENKFINKNPSPYSIFLTNERLSDYYGLKFIAYSTAGNHVLPEASLQHKPMAISNKGISYYRYLGFNVINGDQKRHFQALIDVLKNRESSDSIKSVQKINTLQSYLNGDTAKLSEVRRISIELWKDYKSEITKRKWMVGLDEFSYLNPVKLDLVKLFSGHEDPDEQIHYLNVMIPTISTNWCKVYAQQLTIASGVEVDVINQRLKDAKQIYRDDNIGEHILSISHDLNLYVRTYKPVPEFIEAIRQKYPNKAIILDVWATWCSPCVEDMKKSKATKEKIKDLPLAIVYLCAETGNTQEKWTRKVAEIATKGDHIYMDKKLSGEIMEFFGLSGFPSFIYIDRQGNYHPNLIHHLSIMNPETIKDIVLDNDR